MGILHFICYQLNKLMNPTKTTNQRQENLKDFHVVALRYEE